MWVADEARILPCCGSGVGQQVATVPIRPLAWEPPYAAEAAQVKAKRPKKKKKKKKKKKNYFLNKKKIFFNLYS